MSTTIRRLAVAASAAALVAGVTALPAHAAGSYIAMVYSTANGALGGGTGTAEEAVDSAFVGCRDVNLGTNCQVIALNNGLISAPCVAVAQGATPADFKVGEGATAADAEASALALLPGGSLIGSGCAVIEGDTAPATPGTATVTSDVDIYTVPDGVGEPLPDIFLSVGEQYALVEPCRDSWCHLVIPQVPGGTGWVFQDGFLDVS